MDKMNGKRKKSPKLSLSPLVFEEAVKKILEVKPEPRIKSAKRETSKAS